MFAWMPSESEDLFSESTNLVPIILKQKLHKSGKKKTDGLNTITVGSENTWWLVLNSTHPTGPAINCSISPDHLLKTIGSRDVFKETWVTDKNDRQQTSSVEGLERHYLSKSITTSTAVWLPDSNYLMYLSENIKQDSQSNSDNSEMACEKQTAGDK